MSYEALFIKEMSPELSPQLVQRPVNNKAISAPMNILLVEDNPSDIMLTETVLDETGLDYELHTLRSGAEVMPYLSRQGQYCKEKKTELVMLDLSMPTKDGFEVLAELSANYERYNNLPIIILTGDTHCTFLKNSYDLNITAYLTKPCSAAQIKSALSAIK